MGRAPAAPPLDPPPIVQPIAITTSRAFILHTPEYFSLSGGKLGGYLTIPLFYLTIPMDAVRVFVECDQKSLLLSCLWVVVAFT